MTKSGFCACAIMFRTSYTYVYVQGKSWHEEIKVALSNIQPTVGQWMNRNAAPGHLLTMTLFVKLNTDLKEMWYEHLGWIHVV
jgi:hypothetical protein